MKITGSNNYVKFDLENGYVIKAEGEMLMGRKFVAYMNTMKTWEPPHENEKISKEQIAVSYTHLDVYKRQQRNL